MFRRGGKKRLAAAVALTTVLALGLAAPAAAKDWGRWSEAREWAGGLLPLVLGWLGDALNSAMIQKSEQGTSIDPNGCPKAMSTHAAPSHRGTIGAEQRGLKSQT
jgi:hypothetical protein